MKTGSIEGELRLNGAAATRHNTKAFLWEYRTSENGFSVSILRQLEGLASLRDF